MIGCDIAYDGNHHRPPIEIAGISTVLTLTECPTSSYRERNMAAHFILSMRVSVNRDNAFYRDGWMNDQHQTRYIPITDFDRNNSCG